MPGNQEADFGIRTPQPIEFRCIELCHLRPVDRLEGDRVPYGPDDRPVLRRYAVQVICRRDPAGARHVPGHDVWLARYVLTHVASDRAGVGVISAAGGVTDDKIDVL